MTQPPHGPTPPDGWPPPPGQPGFPPAGFPPAGYPPASGPPAGPAPFPPYPAAAPAKKKRGLLIAAILAVVVLLCAGGGVSAWLLLRNVETGEGAAEPAAAVSAFLDAVYTDKDAARAARLVCSEARDEKAITARVDQIKAYEQKYDRPAFQWDEPRVADRDEERATVTVDLRMITADEKSADQTLTFTVVRKTGWWVCEVA